MIWLAAALALWACLALLAVCLCRGAARGDADLIARRPENHCFREDSPTAACTYCGLPAEAHTGCDCEPVVQTKAPERVQVAGRKTHRERPR